MTIAGSAPGPTRESGGAGTPSFTVIVPTRDRPGLFRVALESVLAQEGASFEVVVVNDGSAAAFQAEYAAIEREMGREAGFPVTYLHLEHLAKGHGPSFALNTGARQAVGHFLCFLDDDDVWIEAGHLARAQAMAAAAPAADLMLFDQAAFRGGWRVAEAIWLEDLGQRLRAGSDAEPGRAYEVEPGELLTAAGFSHVNTTIVAAALFRRVGGFNDALFYENDRDFYLRAIDAAELVLYCPEVVARHNIPDAARTVNMSTRARPLEKHLCQFVLLHHAASTARHGAVRAHGRRHRRYALRKALAAAGGVGDLVRVGAVVARSVRHEMGNRVRGARVLPPGPEGV